MISERKRTRGSIIDRRTYNLTRRSIYSSDSAELNYLQERNPWRRLPLIVSIKPDTAQYEKFAAAKYTGGDDDDEDEDGDDKRG